MTTKLSEQWQEALSLAKEARFLDARMEGHTLLLDLRDPMGQTFTIAVRAVPGGLIFPGQHITFQVGLVIEALKREPPPAS